MGGFDPPVHPRPHIHTHTPLMEGSLTEQMRNMDIPIWVPEVGEGAKSVEICSSQLVPGQCSCFLLNLFDDLN